jgi:hypothetical protein
MYSTVQYSWTRGTNVSLLMEMPGMYKYKNCTAGRVFDTEKKKAGT